MASNPPRPPTPSTSPPPLRPVVRAPERSSGDGDGTKLEQAGRSSTNLSAHASSQALREAARPIKLRETLRDNGNSSKLSKKNRHTSSSMSNIRFHPIGEDEQSVPPSPIPSRPASRLAVSRNEFHPESRSPSQPPTRSVNATPSNEQFVLAPSFPESASSTSLEHRASDENDGYTSESPPLEIARPATQLNQIERTTSDESQRSSTLNASSRPLSREHTGVSSTTPDADEPLLFGLPIPTPRSPRRPMTGSQRNSSASISRLSMPRSVRDLGTDYTRYYNPFATRNNSQQDLTTPLPRYNSSSHLMPSATDLTNRLSNPFKDDKRTSVNHEISQASPPGTPRTHPASPPPEKSAAITAAAIMLERGGTPAFITEADPEKTEFYPYMDDRLGAPYAIPLFVDEKEDDDDMHMPMWDDDKRYRPTLRDRFSRKNLLNTLGMLFLLIGLLCVFVVLPVVSFTGPGFIDYTSETPLSWFNQDPIAPWAYVNDNVYPLLQNIRVGLIDPDTPKSAMTKTGTNGDELVLVFSDEFNVKNRTFYPGDDPYWTGADLWYGATQDLEWYDPDAINTGDGVLYLQLDRFNNHNLQYRSGMLQSWNQMCFKGGMFEVSMSLPGPAGKHAWWPGVWTMGNLGRPGYLATTDGLWPYTYNDCDSGITPNQSMPDGTSNLPGQRLTACSCRGEDHPTPGTGRGAPEIDIAEVSADWGGKGYAVATQSYQVAPFDIWYYPNYDFMQTPNYNLSFVNTYTGGPYQQAVSTTSMLNNNWYDGKEYQTYSFEYTPGGGKKAGVSWAIGGVETMSFDGRAIGPNGNIGQRLVSEEPMSMILNFGFSHSWVDIDQSAVITPAIMRIDYVRIYQPQNNVSVTCDPPGYETTDYIKNHPEPYNNPNLTKWEETGYSWPRNTIMSGCT